MVGATMKKSELAQYKKALLEKKAELEKSLEDGLLTSNPRTDGHGDVADRSSAAIEAEISMRLKQTDAKLLRAITEALARIENGTFGICVDCQGDPLNLCESCPEIPAARLRAVPWTKVCAAVKEKQYAR
jgi:DnaK suppressor protein